MERDYIYETRRGLVKRPYALIFGLTELSKGNKAKTRALFDTLVNTNNFWEIPVETSGDRRNHKNKSMRCFQEKRNKIVVKSDLGKSGYH